MLFTRRGCMNSTYELSDNGRLLGSLKTRSGWKFQALAQMRGSTVEFRQPKWWCRDFGAVDQTTGATVATYEVSTWKRSDFLSVGADRYTLRRSTWGSNANVSDAAGAQLFSVASMDWLGRKLEITLAPGVTFDERIELLVYFTCFALSLSESDSSTAAVAAVVTG